jgi:hypothetical protein
VRFPYRVYEVFATPASGAEDGYIYRPIIPFTLAGPSEALDFFGLVDTGADETYLTRRMADRLGLVVDEATEHIIESASGEVAVRYAQVMIELTDGVESYRWPISVGITDQDWTEAILGHSGFLEYFDVLFRGHEHEVVLTRNVAVLPGTS